AGLGKAQVQRVVADGGQRAVDVDQVLHSAHLGAEDDLVVAQAIAFRRPGRFHRARHHGIHGHFARVFGLRRLGVLVHHAGEQNGVERSPVHADAHGLAVGGGDLDHGAEIIVGLAADIAVAGVDAVLGERAGAFGILLQEDVTVVVEVADDGHAHAETLERVHDPGNGGGGLLCVHGDPNEFGAGARQRHHLVHRGGRVGGVGVGHGLHDDRMIAANLHPSHVHDGRLAAESHCHILRFYHSGVAAPVLFAQRRSQTAYRARTTATQTTARAYPARTSVG